jgi:hypothetical protein
MLLRETLVDFDLGQGLLGARQQFPIVHGHKSATLARRRLAAVDR